MNRLTVFVAAIALVAVACGAADEAADTTAPDTTVVPTLPPADSPEPAPVDETPPTPKRTTDDILPGLPSAIAATDLADRLGVEVSDLTVNVVESVTWPDGSIGCPEPGMSYTQALVPGVRVILQFAGELYYYHGTAPDALFFCENPEDPIPGDPGDA